MIDHGAPVSMLVTASTGLAMTGQTIAMGDASRGICVEVDKSMASLIGLLTYREMGESFFCRLSLSALEVDETRREDYSAALPPTISIRISAL